jgi:hypothetical protein
MKNKELYSDDPFIQWSIYNGYYFSNVVSDEHYYKNEKTGDKEYTIIELYKIYERETENNFWI